LAGTLQANYGDFVPRREFLPHRSECDGFAKNTEDGKKVGRRIAFSG
jgi:hypothetical protein